MIEPFVDAAWVRANPGVILADARCYLDGRSTREAYDAGHLPGAVYIDLDGYLAAAASPTAGRHPLPTPEVFAAGLSAAGIGDGATVVAYDDAGGVMAARLVWLLRALGEDAALLDGGAALLADRAVTGEVTPPPATFTARPWPTDRLAEVAETAAGAVPVIDARDGERYRGEVEPIDPRGGHIPGAVNLPCRANLVDGRLLPVAELRSRLSAAGVRPDGDFISYCGSGVTACHNLVVAEHAGFTGGRLYPGSWSQYSADPGRPVATVER